MREPRSRGWLWILALGLLGGVGSSSTPADPAGSAAAAADIGLPLWATDLVPAALGVAPEGAGVDPTTGVRVPTRTLSPEGLPSAVRRPSVPTERGASGLSLLGQPAHPANAPPAR